MRHLTLEQAVAALRRGKPVEQLLAVESCGGRGTVRWLSLSPYSDGEFVLAAHHVVDAGGPGVVDVYEFPPVDEEEYVGEGVDVERRADPVEALEAATRHGASNERWVNFGVIADEYADARGAS